VAEVSCAAGRVVYKPRPVAVDAALARMLAVLVADEPAPTRIRVPRVVVGDGYGWAEHVAHRYCVDDGELRCFYRNLGHWLAVMCLLGGTDLHAGNLVAAGPVPVVVDCETLFTPVPPAESSGHGLAVDRAFALVGSSILRTVLLPSFMPASPPACRWTAVRATAGSRGAPFSQHSARMARPGSSGRGRRVIWLIAVAQQLLISRCLCCGYRTGCTTCPICFWTDDGRTEQQLDTARGSSPNGELTLREARLNFAIYGACHPRYEDLVRPPRADEHP
jgi:hypothetical protein